MAQPILEFMKQGRSRIGRQNGKLHRRRIEGPGESYRSENGPYIVVVRRDALNLFNLFHRELRLRGRWCGTSREMWDAVLSGLPRSS
jgi:hypothetical protein